jgi:signal transduction histidine kinase
MQRNIAHAVRVAVITTALIASAYVMVSVVFDVVDAHRLLVQVDDHLRDRLSDTIRTGDAFRSPSEADDDRDVEAAPILLWHIDATGGTAALTDATPHLPPTAWTRGGEATTARLGSTSFRFLATRVGDSWLVAAQSLTENAHVQDVLLTGEVIAGPVVVLAAFLGALVIGLKASRPVEAARRRQLEFTADASHELRTPLSVIEAEVSLALGAPRPAAQYRDTLERVGGEGQRLRRIIEDLLWLARFDSEPATPSNAVVDLAAIADSCADRFGAVADARAITLSVEHRGDADACLTGPPDWIDRLTGVLVDNACRYAGSGGRVHIVVGASGNRVSLSVEDSGPGIPAEERPRLFDRFHRITDDGSGTGLGLAIADSIVRSTGGRWRVGDSPLGGAHMEVSWHRAYSRTGESASRIGAPGGGRDTVSRESSLH